MSDALLGLCNSGKMQPIRDLVSKVAVTNTTVLLRGESGVGKEIVARAIHKASPRAAKQFLKDLYYRLNVIEIRIPPLRERREEIPVLVDHFIRKFNAQYGRTVDVPAETLRAFVEY